MNVITPLVAGLKSDGTYEGKFVEKNANLGVSLKQGITKSKKLPEVILVQEGDNRKTRLSINSKGKLLGIFEPEMKQAPLQVELRNSKVSNALTHKGEPTKHELNCVMEDTWGANYCQ